MVFNSTVSQFVFMLANVKNKNKYILCEQIVYYFNITYYIKYYNNMFCYYNYS